MRTNCITWNKQSKADSDKITTLRFTVEGVKAQQTDKSQEKVYPLRGPHLHSPKNELRCITKKFTSALLKSSILY